MENTKKNNKIYIDWLNCNKFSKKAVEQLFRLSPLYVGQSFINEKMKFGTAGIRNKIGPGTNKMNALTYQQMSEGFAKHLINKFEDPTKISIVIGHDNRENADKFSKICGDVLTSFGIKVIFFKNNELMPTPIVSFSIIEENLQGGIIVTASHNPKDYLGFKVYNETGGQISVDEENEIYELMPKPNLLTSLSYSPNNNLVKYFDNSIIKNYYEKAKTALIKTDINEIKIFPIIFTAHHGTASKKLPDFLNSLNYINVKSVTEQCYYDPYFSNSLSSNPEEKLSFELSVKYADKYNSQILLGVDPDADRLAIVVFHNGGWYYLNGNEMGIIFSYYLLSNKDFGKSPFIVSTFVSTNLIEKIAKPFDTSVYRTPTGFKWLGAEITKRINKNENFVVAFEEAIGSLNSTINRDKDSFQSAALILEIFDFYKKKNMTLVDVLEKEIYPKYGFWAGETVPYLISGAKWQQKINAKFKALKNYKLTSLAGMNLLESKWNEQAKAIEWLFPNDIYVKFRMSGTEPKFKAYYNVYGNSVENSKEILEKFKKEIDKLIKSL